MNLVASGLRSSSRLPTLKLKIGGTAISFDVSWVVVIAAAVWAVAALYVPVVAPASTGFDSYEMGVVIVVLILLSLVVHAAIHIRVARLLGAKVPPSVAMFPLGDVAQCWEEAPTASQEASSALVGPLSHAVIAIVFYIVLALMGQGFWANVAFFMMIFSMLLAAVNMTPAFPFDGGRIVRAACWGLLGNKRLGNRIAKLLGFVVPLALIGWGIFLIVQNTRVSSQSSSATFIVVALILLALFRKANTNSEIEQSKHITGALRWLGAFSTAVVVLAMAAITASLVPTNYGLEAPGDALSVAPMVTVPSQYNYPMSGTFYLTTVVPQTPIILGEWVYGHLNHDVRIVPPTYIVPQNQTPQQYAREQYMVLEDSETTAKVVGLRMAGYSVTVNSVGVEVMSLLSGSGAVGHLQAGDVIKSVDGHNVTTPNEVVGFLNGYKVGDTVHLDVLRGQDTQTIDVTLGPPQQAGGAPMIGIVVLPAVTGYSFPFPVSIVPQKTSGGPSAGLMFTLTVYNLTTASDISHGHKIAGTGTIDLNGIVGPIGGVQQKVIAAERVGAEYFLCPADNYKDAVAMAKTIKVIKIDNAQQAIDFLNSLPPTK